MNVKFDHGVGQMTACMALFMALIAVASEHARAQTMAVLDFENRSFMDVEKYAPLSQGLAGMMITELSQVEAVQLVERRRLKDILDELKLAQSGMISESGSVQAGKLLGAHHMVFGSYMVMPGEKIRIDLRIVAVETGSVIKAEEQTGQIKEVLTLIKKLSKKLLSDLSLQMTQQESKLLDEKKNLDIQAVLSYSKGLENEDNNQLADAYQAYKNALAIEPEFEQAKQAIQRIAAIKRNQ